MLINTIIYFIFYFAFGACIGSFLTMAMYRIPNNEDLIFLDSHCPNCGAKLKARSLIPIFSYLIQGGKCLNCKQPISIRYLLIELVNTIVYVSLFFTFGVGFKSIFLGLVFSTIFLIMLIDFKYKEIPMVTTIVLFILSIIHILFNPIDVLYSIFSAFIYFALIKIAVKILQLRKRDVQFLGGGDEKLIIICGLFLTMKYFNIFYIMTGVLGIVSALLWQAIFKEKEFPFGPAILISLYTLLLCYYW